MSKKIFAQIRLIFYLKKLSNNSRSRSLYIRSPVNDKKKKKSLSKNSQGKGVYSTFFNNFFREAWSSGKT